MTMNSLGIDSSIPFNGTTAGGAWYRGEVRRLNDMLFLIRSEGFSSDSFARQQLGLIARLRPIEISIRAGLETQGRTELAGNAVVSGIDTVPGLLGCPVPTDVIPGVRIADADSIDYQGSNCSGGGCTHGNPAVEPDPTINDSTLTTFGDATWDDLRLMANKFPPSNTASTPYNVYPKESGGDCLAGDIENWGEPWYAGHPDLSPSRPLAASCDNYYPIVYVDGDLHINQQRGQGVLIVNGNLYAAGLTRFYGPVLVRGTVVAEGGGSNVPHFYGGIIAADFAGSLDSNRVGGNAEIHYSSCAIARALAGGAGAAPLMERSWVNLN
jgi:hypothetical protein